MYKIGVDIGGTFTDCVVVDDDGRRSVSKSLTTHGALTDGVVSALEANADTRSIALGELLRETTLFVHGTTVATNALLTRTGSKAGLITTRGHEDAIIIGKVFAKRAGLGEREIVHASRLAKPDPIVPPELIHGVSERIDADGDVVVELNEAEAIAAIDALVADGVEAIAVSLLWSFVNDRHEQRLRELIAQRAPHVFATFSSELVPVLGEYERTATTALNAYVGPKVAAYLEVLAGRLKDAGLPTHVLVMQASGGLTSVADAGRRPLLTLDSGPTGGILGCQHLAATYGEANVVCTDVGGTSFDVGLVLGGEVPLDAEPVVAQYSIRIPKVAVASIGAGGGSIAWIDEGGVLRVGPQSAGSRPGPACYGRGGQAPTVTDADLVLGYLNPEFFLGGRMSLDRDLALRALSSLGGPLGMEPEEVAMGVFQIINAHMADLIRKTTIERGNDPRDCVLVAYGGAGATHAAFYGSDIGSKGILVLPDSTAFSAEGMLTCDVTHTAESAQLVQEPFTAQDIETVNAHLDRGRRRVLEQFADEGVAAADVTLERSVGARYRQQVHMIDVLVPDGPVTADTIEQMRAQFEQRYGQLYGQASLLSGGSIEFERFRITGTRLVESIVFEAHAHDDADASAAIKGERMAYFDTGGFQSTPVYAGESLRPGHLLEGPAIVERMGDSVVIPPGLTGEVDRFLTIVIGPRLGRQLSQIHAGEAGRTA
jgi:N-methylhydantoinase A